jgi:pimeloyl-ACP methyl ester carboxylesterase
MMTRPDSTVTLSTISVPALVVVGEEDAMIPLETAKKLKDGIPNATLEVVPEAGHLAPWENPDYTNQAIRKYLQRIK